MLTPEGSSSLEIGVSDYPATREEVVQCFLAIPYDIMTHQNWGTGIDRDWWECNDETYINGVLLTIDLDYMMGYLIEVVDRESGQVNYHAITTFHGRNPHTGHQDHDSEMYDKECGTFFDRTEAADPVLVCQWAVSKIYGMVESYQDMKAKSAERSPTA